MIEWGGQHSSPTAALAARCWGTYRVRERWAPRDPRLPFGTGLEGWGSAGVRVPWGRDVLGQPWHRDRVRVPRGSSERWAGGRPESRSGGSAPACTAVALVSQKGLRGQEARELVPQLRQWSVVREPGSLTQC